MAKAPELVIEPPDRIDNIALPRENPALIGHDAARQTFADALAAGRMHHAWLVTGPPGIGKATFAFHMAKALLSGADPAKPAADTDPVHPAVGKITAGAHPNILHLQRIWNPKTKKHRAELTVDEVRRIIPFFGMTAGEAGWRIVIVDSADEMNRNAANALLKSLEEPPKNALFFVISSRPEGLLATIRSRCRKLPLRPLANTDLQAVLDSVGAQAAPERDRGTIVSLSEGSARRAIELVARDGLKLHADLARMLASPGSADAGMDLIAFARAAADTKSDTFSRFTDFYFGYLHRRIHNQPEPGPELRLPVLPLVSWALLWEKAATALRDVETYNLDRSQFVLELLETTRATIQNSARA